ncbi:MAG: hypothetical protein ABDH28_03115 [Brevinematia bacterium]
MEESAIQLLDTDSKRYVRKVSIKTLLNFFSAEVIGFGFGVPIATVIAIGYGSIPGDIVVGIYLFPIVVTTVFVVLFLAFPTNLYLIRRLVKIIFEPTYENIKTFVLSDSRIPLYASINLFFRIVMVGIIVNIWGYMRQYGNVAMETFLATTISPIFGSWTASIVYFFVLQNILGSYNVKMKDFIHLSKKSEISKIKHLSMKTVYPPFIAVTLSMCSFLIVSGNLLGAGTWGMVMIILSCIIVVSLLLIASYITMTKVLHNITYILDHWEEQREKFSSYGLYDVEEVSRKVYELQLYYSHIESILRRIVESSKDIPDKLLSSSRAVSLSISSFIPKFDVKKLRLPQYQEIRKETSNLNSFVSELIQKFGFLYSQVGYFKSAFSLNLSNSKELVELISQAQNLLSLVYTHVSSLSKLLLGIEENTSYMSLVSREVIISNISKIERYSKEAEMVFINFQLEMAKIGYPGELGSISLQLSRVLGKISSLSKLIKNSAVSFENLAKRLYEDTKKIFISYDSETLLLTDQSAKMEDIGKIPGVVYSSLSEFKSSSKELAIERKLSLQNMRRSLDTVSLSVSRLQTTSKKLEELFSFMVGKVSEVQKMVDSHTEKARALRKMFEILGK